MLAQKNMDNIVNAPMVTHREQPKPIKRPCEYGLESAISNAEIQLGSIEAYNRIVDIALKLREKIDQGKAKPQHPSFRESIKG